MYNSQFVIERRTNARNFHSFNMYVVFARQQAHNFMQMEVNDILLLL